VQKITIRSNVNGGNLKRNRNLIIDAIKSFEGKDVLITFEKPKKKRSNDQNSYYWGVIVPITKQAIKSEWGEIWSIKKVHDFYKMQFNTIEIINKKTGQIVNVPKSTTENTTIEQEDYHSQIRESLKEWFNVECPLPNENLTLKFD
jgi:hypothetical protein